MFGTGTGSPSPILSEEAALLDLRLGLGLRLDGEDALLSRGGSVESPHEDRSSSSADGDDSAGHWEDWLCQASFSHPHVMSRLERLMGTNVVRITDRKYMLELQRRIREDHVKTVRERIRAREADELEREKKLILDGRMSLDEAPKELLDHPVFHISQVVKELLEKGKVTSDVSQTTTVSRGASHTWTTSDDGLGDRGIATPTTTAAGISPRPGSKSSEGLSPRIETPKDESPREQQSPRRDSSPGRAGSHTKDDSPVREGSPAVEGSPARDSSPARDAPARLSTSPRKGSTLSPSGSKKASVQQPSPSPPPGDAGRGSSPAEPPERDPEGEEDIFPPGCEEDDDFDPEQDIERGYMFTQDEYEKLKYETESVKRMWELETVDELYNLAEEIVREIVSLKH